MADRARDRTTHPTDVDVAAFLTAVDDPRRRSEAEQVVALMRQATGVSPEMWGPTIVGFGRTPYRTADGKLRESLTLGLSPRRAALTLYGLTSDADETLRARLGPHTTGKACLYVKRLDDLDLDVLAELVRSAWGRAHDPRTSM